MKGRPAHEAIELRAGDMLCIIDGLGMEVVARYGQLIVTQEQDPEDRVIAPGAAVRVTRQGKTIVAAWCDASAMLHGRAASIALKRYTGSMPLVLYRM